MTENTYITPPSRDAGPPQWSRMDLAQAKSQGRHADITAAHESGQLRDVMAAGGTHGDAGARGGRMDSKQAAEIVRKLDAEAAAALALKEII